MILEMAVGLAFTGFCCNSLGRVGQCFRNGLCTPTFFPKANIRSTTPCCNAPAWVPAWKWSRVLFVLWEEGKQGVTAGIQTENQVARQGEHRQEKSETGGC